MPQRKRLALLAALPALALGPRFVGAVARANLAAPKPSDAVGFPPHVNGRFDLQERFRSRHVAARTIRVWLPPDHDVGEPCGVLYMHDGQNLFAPANPFNHGPWDVDRRLLELRAAGKVRKTMLVGIDNAGADRAREYGPEAVIRRLPRRLRDRVPGSSGDGRRTPMSDAYLRFLVEELKPFVDRRYRTSPGREHTVMMGSSMGGLVSLYALCRYPAVFGAIGGLSTHWPMTTDFGLLFPAIAPEAETMASAWLAWLAVHLPAARLHRIYLDHGDQTLDALYAPYQRQMDAIAGARGYRSGADYLSRVIPGASHDEAAWRTRLPDSLVFLLPPEA